MLDCAPKLKVTISVGETPYREALAVMDSKVQDVVEGRSKGELWFLEHPAMIVGGASSESQDVFKDNPLPVELTSRGGKYTYHGPGQRVCYCILPLSYFNNDIRLFVTELQAWISETVSDMGLVCVENPNIGVWVKQKNDKIAKIASIGLKVRKNVSFFGFSINLNPEIKHFQFFVSCGIKEAIQTSFWNEGVKISMKTLDESLIKTFKKRFNFDLEVINA